MTEEKGLLKEIRNMSDYGAKLPIIIHIGQQFKKNGIVYEVKAQTTSSVLIKNTTTGKQEWKPIESLGGNAGGCEIVG